MEKKTKSPSIGGIVFVVFLVLFLIVLLMPGVSAPMKLARKNAASGNVRQITLSYISYARGLGESRNISRGNDPQNGRANSPAQYAEVLARFTGLATAEVWYIESDDALSGKTIPANVLSQVDNGDNLMKTVSPVSWTVVLDASKELTDKYPLLWTRGLSENGTWSKTSPWGKGGGHIAFGDGHVRWYDNLNLDGNRLTNFTDDTETSDFRDAIGPNAITVEDR